MFLKKEVVGIETVCSPHKIMDERLLKKGIVLELHVLIQVKGIQIP